jgi:hypothetical protein
MSENTNTIVQVHIFQSNNNYSSSTKMANNGSDVRSQLTLIQWEDINKYSSFLKIKL